MSFLGATPSVIDSCLDGLMSFINYSNPNMIFTKVYHQHNSSSKKWVCPDKTRVLSPKHNGYGLMVSAFVSRDFGYGLPLSEHELQEINRVRATQTYRDSDAAEKVIGSARKIDRPLTSSPFSVTFEHGVNNEGYWSYDHVMLQFEDCMDVLRFKFSYDYDFEFFFDHSSGHDKKRADGLCVEKMRKYFGGSNEMHDTLIKDQTYLGEFQVPGKLNVGDTQHMQFQADDEGPFWMDAAEREATRSNATTHESSHH